MEEEEEEEAEALQKNCRRARERMRDREALKQSLQDILNISEIESESPGLELNGQAEMLHKEAHHSLMVGKLAVDGHLRGTVHWTGSGIRGEGRFPMAEFQLLAQT